MMLHGKYQEELARRLALIRDWYECDHEGRVEIRRRTLSDGRPALYEQCTHCGAGGRAVKRSNYTEAEMASMTAFDEELRDARWQEQCAARDAARAEVEAQQEAEKADEGAEFWGKYDRVMASVEWKRKRALVMKRAGGVCEGCGTARAVHVHHLTYKRLGEEMLFDLVAICLACHQALHPDRALSAAS